MKLINHKRDNSYDIDTYVMRGTIEMTSDEYDQVYAYLKETYNQAVKNCDTYVRDSLSSLKYFMGIGYISLGVCATKLIVNKYHLESYKDQNYGIKVL